MTQGDPRSSCVATLPAGSSLAPEALNLPLQPLGQRPELGGGVVNPAQHNPQ